MGKPTGFIEYLRETPPDRSPKERLGDWNEFHLHLSEEKLKKRSYSNSRSSVSFVSHRIAFAASLTKLGSAYISAKWPSEKNASRPSPSARQAAIGTGPSRNRSGAKTRSPTFAIINGRAPGISLRRQSNRPAIARIGLGAQ